MSVRSLPVDVGVVYHPSGLVPLLFHDFLNVDWRWSGRGVQSVRLNAVRRECGECDDDIICCQTEDAT